MQVGVITVDNARNIVAAFQIDAANTPLHAYSEKSTANDSQGCSTLEEVEVELDEDEDDSVVIATDEDDLENQEGENAAEARGEKTPVTNPDETPGQDQESQHAPADDIGMRICESEDADSEQEVDDILADVEELATSTNTQKAVNTQSEVLLHCESRNPCLAHLTQLAIKDAIGGSATVKRILEKINSIVTWFHNHTSWYTMLKDLTGEIHLIRPCVTRWNSQFYCLQRLRKPTKKDKKVRGTTLLKPRLEDGKKYKLLHFSVCDRKLLCI